MGTFNMAGAAKVLRPLLRELLRQGWRLAATGSNHIRAVPPGDGSPVFLSGTPSDHRAIRQIKSDLRKRGFKDST